MNVREPAVAGYFYPGGGRRLTGMLEEFVHVRREAIDAPAVVCPHAGYPFSGGVAGKVYAAVKVPGTVVIIGPNHTGYGEPYSVASHEAWETPLGKVAIDRVFADALVRASGYLEADEVAHRREHSVEVQVPFLQYLDRDVKIVPIVVSGILEDPAWGEIGGVIADARRETATDVLVVASSDMTHYEPQARAEENDQYVIDALLALDAPMFLERMRERRVSLCGYGPILCALAYARELGAHKGILADYRTSGDVTGDMEQVVGYAGILFS